jgi:Holliday junction resolvase-like predicted endonuclease
MVPLRRLLLKQLLIETNEGVSELSYVHERLNFSDEVFDQLISELMQENLITISDNTVILTLSQRIDIAVKALELGSDIEVISRSLNWLEFEELCARVFHQNGFKVNRRFRFYAEGRRWEIDLFAFKKPWIILAECKHWSKGMSNSSAMKIIEVHFEKCRILAEHFHDVSVKAKVYDRGFYTIIPMALTLSPTPIEIYRQIPIVSILSFPSFLNDFDGYLTRLVKFKVNIS